MRTRVRLSVECGGIKNMATGGKKSAGFTIVETLIVLAVSAALATAILITITGRQNKTEFQVAANSLKQKLEQIINETSNGYYPSNNNFTCTGNPALSGAPTITDVHADQGTNSSCIFLGKALEFGVQTDSAAPSAGESFATYPLVANRYATGITEVTNFANAHPIALSSDGAATWPAGLDGIENFTTRSGLNLIDVRYTISGVTTSTGNQYAVFALVDTLGDYAINAQTGGLNSSVQRLNLFDYDRATGGQWSTAPTTSQQVVTGINAGLDVLAGDAPKVSAVQLCFASGATNDSALITIKGNGQLAVTLKIHGGNKTCS